MRNLFRRFDVRVSLIYGITAALWVLFSDILIAPLFTVNLLLAEAVTMAKGLIFVLVTTGVLFVVLRREYGRRTESEDQLRLERQLSPTGIAILSPTGEVRYANAWAERILSLERRDDSAHPYSLPSEHIVDYDGRPIPEEERAFARAVRTGKPVLGAQYAIVQPDGTRTMLEVNAVPLLAPDGSVREVVKALADVTALHSQTMLARQNEARFRQLVEAAPEGIMVQVGGRFAYLNPAIVALFGATAPKDLLGQPILDRVAPEWHEQVGQRIGTLNERREAVPLREEVLLRLDGSRFVTEIMGVPIHYEGQDGALVFVRDVTDRKAAEDNLLRLNQRLVVMSQIDREILAASSIPALVMAVLRQIPALIPCQTGRVLLWDAGAAACAEYTLSLEGPGELQTRTGQPVTAVMPGDEPPSGSVIMRPLPGGGERLIAPLPLYGRLELDAAEPFSAEHCSIAEDLARQLTIALQNARLVETIRTQNDEMAALSVQLVEAQETERRFIAHELHDEIGQSLTALSLMLQREQRESRADTPSEAPDLLRDLMQRVRELSLSLRPSMLDDLGLIPTLAWYLERYQTRTGIRIDFKYSGISGRFSPQKELTLYRIVQEALTNVARYAGVQQATVRLWAADDRIHAQIADEGAGFDPDGLELTRTGGLLGMRERARIAGGVLDVVSAVGAGTTVSVSLPGNGSNGGGS